MNERNRNNKPVDAELNDPTLQAAMRDFRASVHAWSDAAYNRPRSVAVATPHRRAWRRAAAWVLSFTLSCGIVGTAAYEHHHRAVVAQERQHQQELERQRLRNQEMAQQSAQQHEKETEDLMANIDSDVSRQVPTAMEPLAALMTDDSQ